ncbi:protein CANDIDATE G-PROTEIN COUPLED RECEPTOR 2-like [Gossypium raimondii]|uniref:protein CANDIDATE G-PROTEIN COUPLED RECEPTOR 2-like n=1 Tax=Gossypium raimondii TaxID=29730 RepID=UPI00227AC224|nr:protein CANDIDATE G-PROTEIN COUPLED RECEPTOR 2-like [Gossypium raimondii]
MLCGRASEKWWLQHERFGFGVPLFIDNSKHLRQIKWGLWVVHRLVLIAIYGSVLFMYHSKWRERLWVLVNTSLLSIYNPNIIYISILCSFSNVFLKRCTKHIYKLYIATIVCYHAFYLPFLYITFLADFFEEEDVHLENVYYSEMKDDGFFDADWE